MTPLSPKGRALVAVARGDDPSAADRARVRAALAARLGAAALPPASSTTPALPAPAAPVAATALGKAIATGVLLGVMVIGGRALVAGRSAPPAMPAHAGVAASAHERAVAVERADTPASLPLPEGPPPPSAEPQPAPPRAVAQARPIAPPPSAHSSLADEVEALRRAQAALRAGDSAAAIGQIDHLARRHPDGLLREERRILAVLALCTAGRADEARREAERLLAETPNTIHAAKLRASCAFAPKGDGSAP
jgi:hypothetical protein